jgi:transcription termination/antitermination protein NusA
MNADSSEEVRQLFFERIPEVADGTVEIKAIAREPGIRSMLLVHSKDRAFDSVGACIGPRGARVKLIVEALAGEHMDIIRWSESLEHLIRNALAPLVIQSIAFDPPGHRAIVCVRKTSSDQTSVDSLRLRLAASVVGWELQLVDV